MLIYYNSTMISTIYNNLFNLFSDLKLPNTMFTKYNISKKIQFNSLIGIFVITFYLKILLSIEIFFCIVYPVCYSINSLEKNKEKEKNTIIKYWTIYSLYKVVEIILDYFGNFIILYSILKLIFLIYLIYNNFKGSSNIFDNYINFFYLKYKDKILEYKRIIIDLNNLKIDNKS